MYAAVWCCLAFAPALVDAAWPPVWSWGSVQMSAFPGALPHSYGGFFNATTMAELKRNRVVGLMGINVSCVQGEAEFHGPQHTCPIDCTLHNDFIPSQHENTISQARALKAANPGQATYGYLYTTCNQRWYNYSAALDAHTAFLMRDGNGAVVACPNFQGSETNHVDMSNAAYRAWWLENAVGPYAREGSLDGIFFDEMDAWLFGTWHARYNVSLAREAAWQEGMLSFIEEATGVLAGHGKVAWFSTNILRHYSGTEAERVFYGKYEAVLAAHTPHGGVYWEFFVPSVANLLDQIRLGSLGIPLQAHCGTGPRVYPSDPRFPAFLSYNLGAFLLGVAPLQYFQYSANWRFDAFPWLADYDRPLGAPLGAATNSTPTLWTRRFEHAAVTVDFKAETGAIAWA